MREDWKSANCKRKKMTHNTFRCLLFLSHGFMCKYSPKWYLAIYLISCFALKILILYYKHFYVIKFSNTWTFSCWFIRNQVFLLILKDFLFKLNLFGAPCLLCCTNHATGLQLKLELLWPFDQGQVYLGFEVKGFWGLTAFLFEGQEERTGWKP